MNMLHISDPVGESNSSAMQGLARRIVAEKLDNRTAHVALERSDGVFPRFPDSSLLVPGLVPLNSTSNSGAKEGAAAPRSEMAFTLALSRSRRDAYLGLGCSLGFLYFVSKFNDVVQTYKASHNIKKGVKLDKGLWRLLAAILRKTCGAREATTVGMLCISLLLRTFGSVWVSKHWGKIVKSIVTRNFPRMGWLLGQFSVVTLGLALLNAMLKYYISTLKEQVREKITRWCHDRYAVRPFCLQTISPRILHTCMVYRGKTHMLREVMWCKFLSRGTGT
jgi:hypothetical protein